MWSKKNCWIIFPVGIILCGMCALLAFGALIIASNNGLQPTPATALNATITTTQDIAPTKLPAPTATRDPNVFYSDYAGTFTYLAKEAVLVSLKSPSTAEFPGIILEIDEWRFAKQGDLIMVQSWVDAQNSYGAVIRSEYTAQFSFNSEELLFLSIDGDVIYGNFQEP